MDTCLLTTTVLFLEIYGKSIRMKEALETIQLAADTRASVLITGEKGTEKELVAEAIHHTSSCQTGPFVRVNCSELPDMMMEIELFGNSKQPVENTAQARPGKLELAHGGTLFLDEISELNLSLQEKLLSALKENHLNHRGGRDSFQDDFRVISATHKDLWKCIREKAFHYDLYTRLNAIPIHIPPLRERKEDIPMLAGYYLEKFCEEQNKDSMQLSSGSQEALMLYDWPGNMEEFISVMERIAALHSGGKIEKQYLPSVLIKPFEKDTMIKTPAGQGMSLEVAVSSFEKGLIVEALKQNGGIKARAARQLGLSRSNLQYKIKKYGITKL